MVPDKTIGIVGVAAPGSFSMVTAKAFGRSPPANCDKHQGRAALRVGLEGAGRNRLSPARGQQPQLIHLMRR